MSNFEKIGVIFVTGLVAVILAMSFFGTGHPLPEENGDDQAKLETSERSTPAGGRLQASRGPSSATLNAADEQDVRPSWGSMGSRSAADANRREAAKRSLAADTKREPASGNGHSGTPRAEGFATPPSATAPATIDSSRQLADASSGSGSASESNPSKLDAAAAVRQLWDMARKTPPVGERADAEPSKPNPFEANRAMAQMTPAPKTIPVADRGQGEKQTTPARDPKSTEAIAKTRTYEIQPRDTLSEIAQRELGTTQALPRLLEANPGLDPRRLIVGAEIRIPVDGGSTIETPQSAQRSSATPEPRVYEVQPMDTLSGIAQSELGTSKAWRRLVEANPGIDPNRLRVGMQIRIPVSETVPTPKPKSRKADDASRLAQADTESDSGARFYLVGAGETLTEIAQEELGTTKRWKELYELNRDRLASADRLIAGQRLRLPE